MTSPEPAGRASERPTGYAFLDGQRPVPGRVLAFAHRGGAHHPELVARENTLYAFQHAYALGYRYLETDVHATRDGHVIAFHDGELDRVTDRSGVIADLTLAEVREAKIGGHDSIPTMAELLEALPTALFNIDVKSDAVVEPLVRLIERYDARNRVLVGSFSIKRLRRFRNLTHDQVASSAGPWEVAAYRLLPGFLATRVAPGSYAAFQVPLRQGPLTVVTDGFLRRAHRAGKHVHVWTIDDEMEMTHLLDRGVDGLVTDRTDILKTVLSQRGQWKERS